VQLPPPITCSISARLEGAPPSESLPALVAGLQTALRLEGGSDIEIEGSSLRFRMAGWGNSLRSNWHWSAHVSSGVITLTRTADAYTAVGRLYLWRLGIVALAVPALVLVWGTPIWLAVLGAIGLWLFGYTVAKTSFESWIGEVLSELVIGNHRAAVAP
jgi:hypothetical protein